MDQWNHRMMFQGGMPTGVPPNTNNQQNFYRPTNPQQLYHTPGPQFHGGFQPRQAFPQTMNPMIQNFPPAASQPHPTRPMTPAELENIKKKRNFEEQQKRLMALKQKGGRSMASQVENPLNDLFGKKGNSGGMKTLLGSLGDMPHSKLISSSTYQVSSNLPGQAPQGYNFNSANNIPTPVASNMASSNWNTPGRPNINPPAGPLQPSGDFEQFQGFSSQPVQDDFGDFQQSSGAQFPTVAPRTVQPDVLPNKQTSLLDVPSSEQPKQNPVNTGVVPVTSSMQRHGDIHLSSTVQPSLMSPTQQSQLPRNTLSGVTTAPPPVTTGDVERKVPVSSTTPKAESMIHASATPSIEDLMKKSLTLDNQSSSSGKRFEKPKVTKTIKVQPSHFTESTKASKFENLDTLSEIFTIPQAALVKPMDSGISLSHATVNTSDDWSDFSSATETIQQQNLSTEPATSTVGQGVPNSPTRYPSTDQMLSTSGHPSSELTTFQWESDCTLLEAKGEKGIYQQPVSIAPTGSMWIPQVSNESGGMLVGVNTPISHGISKQQMVSGGEFGDFQSEVPSVDAFSSLPNDQAPDVNRESPVVDPELVTYGVSLPDWTKDTSKLPAVYTQVHRMCSSPSNDVISTSQLYPVLLSSDLPRDKLGYIWSKCNKAIPGELNEKELYLILGMVALAQVGLQVNKLTLEKLASCTTAPIPSLPESIFQNEANPPSETLFLTTPNPEPTMVAPADPINSTEIFHPTPHVDAVKHPDWSKWKTSKAGQVDDKFTDFQILKPTDTSDATIPSLNWSNSTSDPSSASYQSLPISGSFGSADQEPSKTLMSDKFSIFGEQQSSSEGSLVAVDSNKSEIFGEKTSQQSEMKAVQNSSHVMPIPLQLSQRYTLTEESESVDHHEKAWLKCLASCFTVIMKSYQSLQNISDPSVTNEIFSSQAGKSHFLAIIEIYCVSQRIKASVLKSAPNNEKLKESLQNIDNIWKTYTSYEPFQKLLPVGNFNFSSCHINNVDDVNMSCGVCLLHVDKSGMNLSQRNQCGKLNYGNRQYHMTCANFWCNKVDSVLPSLLFNNSLI